MSVHAESPVASDEPRLTDLVDVAALGGLVAAGRALAVVEGGGEVLAGCADDPEGAREVLAAWRTHRAVAHPAWPASAPIRLRQHLIGAVMARDPEEAGFVSGLARVIEKWAHAQYELQSVVGELVWRYEELSVLYDSSETIVSIMDLEDVSRRILVKARDMLDVDNASLMLLDADTRELRIQDAIGLERDVVESMRLAIGEEISGWVAKEGKPLLIEDIESHPLFKKVNQERYINRSLLSVPLKIKDRVIGVLNVNNKRSGHVFNSGDLKLLSALASLAAISIENAHTYKNAITDRLTRLYNYGYFREELARKIQAATTEGVPLSLLMFDIDHFKNFNDKNGHELANVALVRIANICLENSRQKGDRIPDLVARYGGEEFMILLYGVDTEGARVTAERVREAVEGTRFQGGENQPGGRVTISMGVATYPLHAADGDELVNLADKSLYKAKKGGRNQVQTADAL
jgi:diguanylate cyclase (GGDEF)-like protein